MHVEPHDTHFPGGAPDDPVWIKFAARMGWIGLTTDKDMSTFNDVALTTLMLNGGRGFVCIGSHNPFPKIAKNIVNSRYKMNQFVHKHRRKSAWVARLYMASGDQMRRGKGGEIKMYLTYAEWRARKPTF